MREVLVAQLGLDADRVVDQARLADDLGLDSLALTEVLLTLEDELAISIPDVVQAGLQSFADLVAVVASQVTRPRRGDLLPPEAGGSAATGLLSAT